MQIYSVKFDRNNHVLVVVDDFTDLHEIITDARPRRDPTEIKLLAGNGAVVRAVDARKAKDS